MRALTTTTSKIKTNKSNLGKNSLLIWEKIGPKGRNQKSKLFSITDTENLNYIITSWYHPSNNVIRFEVFDKNVTVAPKDISLDTYQIQLTSPISILFFIFNERNQIDIYTDCPSMSNKVKSFQLFGGLSVSKKISKYDNTKYYLDIESGMNDFNCESIISVITGTVIQIYEKENLDDIGSKTFLSLWYEGEEIRIKNDIESLYVEYFNPGLENQKERLRIGSAIVARKLSDGIFFYFTDTTMTIHENCKDINISNPIGSWNTNTFASKILVRTGIAHTIGNAANKEILSEYCDNIKEIYGQSYINKKNVLMKYLPFKDMINSIDLFESYTLKDFGNLIENEPKILIASRVKSCSDEFFYRGIDDYEKGFTDYQGNMWIGLDLMNKITNKLNMRLRVVYKTDSNIDIIEEYLAFKVGNKSEKYKLNVAGLLVGKNGHFAQNNGAYFSTFDFGNRFLASKSLSGYWYHQEQTFCFTCVTTNNQTNELLNVTLSGFNFKNNFNFRMYLIVS